MFSLFYLETIHWTKQSSEKQRDDQCIGHIVNIAITIFYMTLFGSLWLSTTNIQTDENEQPLCVSFLKGWYGCGFVFSGQAKTGFTIFDLSGACLVVILFIH